MSDFITAVTGTNGLTSTNLWADVTLAAPLIVSVAVFAFGYYICKKVIKGAAKGKVKM